jgi:hypothetical protein
MGGI